MFIERERETKMMDFTERNGERERESISRNWEKCGERKGKFVRETEWETDLSIVFRSESSLLLYKWLNWSFCIAKSNYSNQADHDENGTGDD